MSKQKDIDKILRMRRIAVVGISDKPERASFAVARYLRTHGYSIVPINPNLKEWQGIRCYPDLKSAPEGIEAAVVFRRSDEAADVTRQAIEIGAKAVWLQEGVVSLDAEEETKKAGIACVMDACMMKEHRRIARQRQGSATSP